MDENSDELAAEHTMGVVGNFQFVDVEANMQSVGWVAIKGRIDPCAFESVAEYGIVLSGARVDSSRKRTIELA